MKKTLGTEEDTRRWRHHLCSKTDQTSAMRMSVLTKLTHVLNVISVKIPMMFFTDLEKAMLKCIWKPKDPEQQKQS